MIEPGERIVFTRTVPAVPPLYSESDWKQLFADRAIHEAGPINNICADWGMVLSQGLLGRRAVAQQTLVARGDDPEAREFLESAIESCDAVIALAARYAQAALDMGRVELADLFRPLRCHHVLDLEIGKPGSAGRKFPATERDNSRQEASCRLLYV